MRKILIVDDERNVHYSFRRALEGEFEVQSAFDGDQALASVGREVRAMLLLLWGLLLQANRSAILRSRTASRRRR